MMRICVVCRKEYECFKKGKKGTRTACKRGYNSITCSKKCSKKWGRERYNRENGK